MTDPTTDDPKGLMREAFRIESITKAECRSIFLDWALSIEMGQDTHKVLRRLLAQYGADPDHPMTQVLREGLHGIATPRRRGGWRSRKRD